MFNGRRRGTKPNPFQCITNLSRMFNGRREPNPFQYVTNLSRMFNLDISQV